MTPDFCTVENTNENTIMDPIRVLDRNQIAPFEKPLYQQPEFYPPQEIYPQQASYPDTNYPNITVSPVIKIVNGDDKSTNEQTEPIDSQPESQKSFIVKNPEKMKATESQETDVDFSKPLIIKKM
jgi:hypothetical protein